MPLTTQRVGSGVPEAVPGLAHSLPDARHIGLHNSAFCSCSSLCCCFLFMFRERVVRLSISKRVESRPHF